MALNIEAWTTSVATGALALVAGIALWRENKRVAERSKAADARIGALAFPLRRQILSWVNGPWGDTDGTRRSWAKHITMHVSPAEQRIERMLEAAASAAAAAAETTRLAAKLFYGGTRYINELLVAPSDQGDFDPKSGTVAFEILDREAVQRYDEAQVLLKRCARVLEDLVQADLLGDV